MRNISRLRVASPLRFAILSLFLVFHWIPAKAEPFAYITNTGNNTVSVIDTATNTVIAPAVPVGIDPFGVAVHPDGTRVYVANGTPDNSVSVINTATNTVTDTIPVGIDPEGVGVSQDGTRVYVANSEGNSVSVIDTTTNSVIDTVLVGLDPVGIGVTPDGTQVYVIGRDSVVIDTATNTVTATLPASSAGGVAFHPSGTPGYVRDSGVILVIDTASNTLSDTVIVGPGAGGGVAVTPDGTRVYASNSVNNTVSVIDTATNTLIDTVSVGTSPDGLAVTPDGTAVYVANLGGDTVSVIDTATNTVTDTITLPAGSQPRAFGQFIGPSPIPSLAFPLKGSQPGVDNDLDPYNARITSVFDHFMSENDAYHIYGCDDVVTAYTGEMGNEIPSNFNDCVSPGFTQDSHKPFYVNGHYVGADDENVGEGEKSEFLNYDGHPGTDYKAAIDTEVYAPVSGTIYYPRRMVAIGKDSYSRFHYMALIPNNFPKYRIYLAHLSTHKSCLQKKNTEDCKSLEQITVADPSPRPGCPASVQLPLKEGSAVQEGCLIALSGKAGVAGPHLHFEVQKLIEKDDVSRAVFTKLARCIKQRKQDQALDGRCVPVDPYGWDGDGPDPYDEVTGIGNVNVRLWSHVPIVSVVTSENDPFAGVNVTITGKGFDDIATDCLVQKSEFESSPANPICLTGGAILDQSVTHLTVNHTLDPDTYFVHVDNSDGKRSNWKALVIGGG